MTLNAIVSVADEQVTAATQQRALDESDNSEQLQLEPTPQFQPTANTVYLYVLFLQAAAQLLKRTFS